MNLVRKSAEVYLAEGPISSIGDEEIALIKRAATESQRGRVRINIHPDGEDRLHEMFIALRPDSYIHPHKHPSKSEAFHIVYGTVDIVIFDDNGEILKVVPLGAPGSGRSFYYRMSKPFFHTLMIRSELLVVHEITNGPFQPGGTIMAPFAPNEGDRAGAGRYIDNLAARLAARESSGT